MYQKQGRQTFLAKAFDLMKDPGGKPGDKYIGSSWSANSDTWWADHYNIDDDGKDEDVANWKKDGLADIYKYLQQQGEELQKKSQPYNVIGKVAGNNCITEAFLKTITVDKEKCE
ncbi:uncharacterized protein ACHE_30257A [Aspergillus chevalieri]|uniref:Uncharacterized protein n=1 Tax=Aspergillus chevalieri TaxID=182096 RepID=A0A7R7ZKY4_ASPCH|nr:uncharacterized protein ACHE_30257A [Aspergillus chevalieri]BCR86270.1 hypothetical protein ACHE_30257A [Aspergillus chevalieri]